MRVQDVMTRPAITVHTGTPAKEAAATLAGCKITAMPVLDEDDAVVGMISEADLLRHRLPHDPRLHLRRDNEDLMPAATVGDLMSSPAIAVSSWSDAADAAEQMLTSDVRSMPVVDGDRVVGVVSRRDLLKTLLRDDESIAAEIRHRLDTYSSHRDRWQVTVLDGAVTISGPFTDAAERRVVGALARTVSGVTHAVAVPRHRFSRSQG